MTGTGTALDPYVIWDVNDLQDVRLHDAAYFELGSDIDASGTAVWYGGLGFEPLDWPYPQKRRASGDFASVGAWTVFPVAPATKWDKVDEVDQDGDATYIRIDAAGGEVLFTSPNFNIPAGSTNIRLQMEVISRTEAPGDADAKVYIRVNGTNYETAFWREISDNVAYEFSDLIGDGFVNNPDTGLPWTVDDINGVGPNPLQAWGLKVQNNACRITKIDALVFCDPGVIFSFDGKGHTISDLTIDRALAGQPYDRNSVGLFRYIAGAIRNLNSSNCNIIGRAGVGGIASQMLWVGGSISGCNVSGRLEATHRGVGGICDFDGSGDITDCDFTGTIVTDGSGGGIASYAWKVPAGGAHLRIANCHFNGQIGPAGDVNGGIVAYASECDLISCRAQGSITGEAELGGIAGEGSGDMNLTDCNSEAAINGIGAGWDHQMGGLVGVSWGAGRILRCIASGNVISPTSEYVAGLIGYSNSRIEQSIALGNVSGDQHVGGLVGISYESVLDSYGLGDVSANLRAGGLIGRQNQVGSVVERCYSAGLVVGAGANIGGLIGLLSFGTVNDCFWDTETSGRTTSAGGTGKTTAQMKEIATFFDSGWDIAASTLNPTNGYPFLAWQSVWLIFGAVVPPPVVPTVMTLPATGVT